MALASAAISVAGAGDAGQQLHRHEIDDTAEAGDQVAAIGDEAIEAEIGEPGIAGGLLVAGEVAAPQRRIVVRSGH